MKLFFPSYRYDSDVTRAYTSKRHARSLAYSLTRSLARARASRRADAALRFCESNTRQSAFHEDNTSNRRGYCCDSAANDTGYISIVLGDKIVRSKFVPYSFRARSIIIRFTIRSRTVPRARVKSWISCLHESACPSHTRAYRQITATIVYENLIATFRTIVIATATSLSCALKKKVIPRCIGVPKT